jgi:hypothetical protein
VGNENEPDVEFRDVQVAEEPELPLCRRPRNAPAPTQERLHEETHEPFRLWCRACVAGLAKAFLALARERQEKSIPIIGIDYCFFRHEDAVAEEADDAPELDTTPSGLHHVMIFGRCSEVRWLLGHVLPCKGDTP